MISGLTTRSPVGSFYWLQADSPRPTRWTYNKLCSYSGSRITDCRKSSAGVPISPQDNFGKSEAQRLSLRFTKNRRRYFYLTKFAYAFHIIGLFLTLCAVIMAFFLFKFLILAVVGALFFVVLASCLITAVTVQVRNAFHDAGHSAKIGVRLMAFTWTSVALLSLVFLLALAGLILEKGRKYGLSDKSEARTQRSDSLSSKSEGTLRLLAKKPRFGSGMARKNYTLRDSGLPLPPQERVNSDLYGVDPEAQRGGVVGDSRSKPTTEYAQGWGDHSEESPEYTAYPAENSNVPGLSSVGKTGYSYNSTTGRQSKPFAVSPREKVIYEEARDVSVEEKVGV